jgi:hypothetical protein
MIAGRDLQPRAMMSEGASNERIYQAIAPALRSRKPYGSVILDIRCGRGALRAFVAPMFDRYVGTDLVHYDSFPAECEFRPANLDQGCLFRHPTPTLLSRLN